MPTGACGINCDVCKLNVIGVCSTCGAGTSLEGSQKAEVQIRLFGQPCPILGCAQMNCFQYCMRDCSQFPCDNFRNGYPFSDGFLNMQSRRRQEKVMETSPQGSIIKVPPEYWDELLKRDIGQVCNNALAAIHPEGLMLNFLNEELLIDFHNRCIWQMKGIHRGKVTRELLELVVLVYLLNAKPEGIRNEIVSVRDLKDAHFFQGPHELRTSSLLKRYGTDAEGFRRVAISLSGKATDMADAAFQLRPLPKILLYYLLWEGDEEFTPRISILFDRSIETHLSADAIWGLVNLVSGILLEGKV